MPDLGAGDYEELVREVRGLREALEAQRAELAGIRASVKTAGAFLPMIFVLVCYVWLWGGFSQGSRDDAQVTNSLNSLNSSALEIGRKLGEIEAGLKR